MKLSPGVGGDPHHDLIGEHLGAAGDGAAVAAGLADHRGRFAGDGRFVHGGGAFDDLAVGRNRLPGQDHEDVTLAQGLRRHGFQDAIGQAAIRHGLGAGLAQGGRLGLAPAFGHGLGKVGEQHREPEPQGDLQEEAPGAAVQRGIEELGRGDQRPHHGHKHHRIADHQAGIELPKGIPDRRDQDRLIKQ